MSEEIAVRSAAAVAPRFRLVPSSLGEAMEMARLIAGSELCPKAYRGKPADCIVAYEYGAALGFSWMQSLRAVAVINGTPAIFGDAVPAVILGSGQCERFHEYFEGTPFEDTYKAVCIIKRKGLPDEFRRDFSVADAKTAKLWQKRGRDGQDTPWITHPGRMLQMRARFAVRDAFADKLSGLVLFEEAMDYPDAIPSTVVTSEIVASPQDLLAKVSDGLRGQIERAFAELKFSAPIEDGGWRPTGLGLTKLTEFLGGDGVPDEGAQHLLDWCRSEFAQRAGRPRKAKADQNAKHEPPVSEAPPSSPQSGPPPAGSTASPAGAAPSAPAPASPQAPPVTPEAPKDDWALDF